MKGKAEPMNVYFLTRKTPEIAVESPTSASGAGFDLEHPSPINISKIDLHVNSIAATPSVENLNLDDTENRT